MRGLTRLNFSSWIEPRRNFRAKSDFTSQAGPNINFDWAGLSRIFLSSRPEPNFLDQAQFFQRGQLKKFRLNSSSWKNSIRPGKKNSAQSAPTRKFSLGLVVSKLRREPARLEIFISGQLGSKILARVDLVEKIQLRPARFEKFSSGQPESKISTRVDLVEKIRLGLA